MEADKVINSFLAEAVSKKSVSKEDITKFLKNLYRRYYVKLDKPFEIYEADGFDDSVHMVLPLYKLLPGMHYDGREVYTTDFERKYIRPRGWTIESVHLSNFNIDRKENHSVSIDFFKRPSRLDSKRIPRYLYHISPMKNKASILRRGLIPKSQPEEYEFRYSEPRVYLFIKEIVRRYLEEIPHDEALGIFRIDTDKFKKFNIFYDPMTYVGEGYYTLTHIPARAVTFEREIEF